MLADTKEALEACLLKIELNLSADEQKLKVAGFPNM